MIDLLIITYLLKNVFNKDSSSGVKKNYIPIYGIIGYVILLNTENNNKIIIFSDKHDDINKCSNQIESISIDKLFENIINNDTDSEILLEEVKRSDQTKNINLLWNSDHTVNLKNLYIENQNKINGIDIRPYLIPFSLIDSNLSKNNSYTIEKYLINIDSFFNIEFEIVKRELGNLYTKEYLEKHKLGQHFYELKKKYIILKEDNKNILNKNISLLLNNEYLIQSFDNLLSSIIEWYICALTIKFDKNIIIHTGLAHSEQVVINFYKKYGYSIINHGGIIKLEQLLYETTDKTNGCIFFPIEYINMILNKNNLKD